MTDRLLCVVAGIALLLALIGTPGSWEPRRRRVGAAARLLAPVALSRSLPGRFWTFATTRPPFGAWSWVPRAAPSAPGGPCASCRTSGAPSVFEP